MNRSEQSMLGHLSRCGLTAALVASAFLAACSPLRPMAVAPTPSFVFRSLDLRQSADNGNRDWDLTSPEARYDLSSRTIRGRRPEGIVYRDDRPYFQVEADIATVLQDGELIVLEGSVQLKELNERGLLIKGDNLIWTPSQSRLVINQQPVADDGQTQIRARELIFQQDQNLLELKGPTQLISRDRNGDIGNNANKRIATTYVNGGSGVWNLESGDLSLPGPVEAIRTSGETLNATGLSGNTNKGFLDLSKPVTLLLQNDQGVISAGETRWFFSENQLQSNQPVRADLKSSTIQSTGFRLDERSTTIILSSSCRVDQKNEILTARRCSWNWNTDRIVADEDVVLLRSEPKQTTNATRMEGVIGSNGQIRFGQAGARVESTIKLSPAAQEKPRRPQVSF